jgi:galactose mutarotase-like enzyme
MNSTKQTTWHGFPAIMLENELIRTIIVPNLGAKIVSLFDKTCQHEWLAGPMRSLKQTSYGADFVSQDMSGWDEMMPTIVSCDWDGAQLPDHGEVWSIPWTLENTNDAISLSVVGTAMPYHFARSVAFSAPDCLELRYSLTNTGKKAYPFLWTAHPQFVADSQTRIVLPLDVTQMVNVVDDDPNWGKAGGLTPWPAAVATTGEARRLDQVRLMENHACRKFYIPPGQAVSWAALIHEGLGCQLRLEWSPLEIPYLGLWVDEGAYNIAPVVALEPSDGYYDSLERAVRNQKVTVLESDDIKNWTLTLRFGKNQ